MLHTGRSSIDLLLVNIDRPLGDLAIALATRVTTASLVEAQYNDERARLADTNNIKNDEDYYNNDGDGVWDEDDDSDDDEIEDDPCGAASDSEDDYVDIRAIVARAQNNTCPSDARVVSGHHLAPCDQRNDDGDGDNTDDEEKEEGDDEKNDAAIDNDHQASADHMSVESLVVVAVSTKDEDVQIQNALDGSSAATEGEHRPDGEDEDEDDDDDDDDDLTGDYASRAEILSICPLGGHKHVSNWQPMIDACLNALTQCGTAQDTSVADGDGGGNNVPHPEAADVLCRFLPTLAAYDFDVYDVTVHPENAGCIGRVWDDDGWLATAYCGIGDWLLRVACRRTRLDDRRTGPERAGGAIRINKLVHRHHRRPAPFAPAPLGDGYNRYTHELLAFVQSHHVSLSGFVDACYEPLKGVARVLYHRFGWSIKGARNDKDYDDTWDDDSFTYDQSNEFVRASDGATVTLAWHEGSLIVCGRGEPSDVAPSLHATIPCDQRQRLTIPRPPNDYDTSIQYGRLGRERKHADRTYLVQHKLLDPMYATPLGRLPKRETSSTTLSWPCVYFPYDPYTLMDAETKADWHRRLTECMDLVARLKQRGPMGDLFISSNDMHTAINTASPRMAAVAGPAIRTMARFDAHALDSMFEVMLSPMLLSSWRVNMATDHVRYGSRYVDAARGLYVNWSMRCNFVSCVEAIGLVHPRFYGHILVLDESKRAKADEAVPMSIDDDTHCLRDRDVTPLTVVAYYALTLRDPETYKSRVDREWSTHGIATMRDTDTSEREAIDQAITAINPALESRFGRDEPHHVIDYYRRREFDPVPASRFRGIIQEDALDVGPATTPAIAIVHAFDWLRDAFERHATVFGVPR
nr:hypothetical protein [Pandoravirus aubagnensis]